MIDYKFLAGAIIVTLMVSVAVVWTFEKNESVLERDGEVIGKHRWVVEAERTYIVKNSWYRENRMCPKIVADGGYETPTRCYYAPDTYEGMSRSLINTDLFESGGDVTRVTPYYAYGSRGSYAGFLTEVFDFEPTDDPLQFPKDYDVFWNPKDTRNYKLIWRVYDLESQPLPDGNYSSCEYFAEFVKIDLRNACASLERAEVKNDQIYFYFDPARGDQSFSPLFVDPDPTTNRLNETLWLDFCGGNSSDKSMNNLKFAEASGPFTYTNWSHGCAVEFDGGADYLQNDSDPVPDLLNFSRTDAYTVTAWVFQDNNDDQNHFFEFGNSRIAMTFLTGASAGELRVFHNPATINTFSDIGGFAAGTWEMVTVTYNTTHVVAYRNATASSPVLFGDIAAEPTASHRDVQIGVLESQTVGFFDGKIANYRLYNFSLNQTEVEALYDGGNGTNLSLLAALQAQSGGGGEPPAAGGEVELYLDTLAQSRDYEFGTTANLTANITSGTVCIEVFAPGGSPNFTCGGSGFFVNYTINKTAVTEFQNEGKSFSPSSGEVINVSLDNRTDLLSLSLNVSGSGDLRNVSVYDGNGSLFTYFDGYFDGPSLIHDTVYHNRVPYKIRNVTFPIASTVTLFVNFSKANVGSTGTASFNLSSFTLNEDSQMSYSENFSNSDKIGTEVRVDSPDALIENYEVASPEALATRSNSISGTPTESQNTITDGRYLVRNRDLSPGIVFAEESDVNNWVTTLDLRHAVRLNFTWTYNLTCSVQTDTATDGYARAYARYRIYDGVSKVNVQEYSVNCNEFQSASQSATHNVSVSRAHLGTETWNWYINGVDQGTFSTSSLDDNRNWTVTFDHNVGTQGGNPGINDGAKSESYLDSLWVSGVSITQPEGSVRSALNGSLVTSRINETVSDAFSLQVDWEAYEPNGTSVVVYVSNDDGATWEETDDGENHQFETTTGSELRINFTLSRNASVTNQSPLVYKYSAFVLPGSPDAVTVDFGADGVSDFLAEFAGAATTIHVSNSSSPLTSFLSESCGFESVTCSIPIALTSNSSGLVQVSNVSIPQKVNPISLSNSFYDSKDPINFSFSFDTGTLTVNNLEALFRGSQNITVTAFDQSDRTSNQSYNLSVKYSKFSLDLPGNVSEWFVVPATGSSKNVTPFGQTESVPIFNVTSLAYDKDFNVSIRLNGSLNSCINITVDDSNVKSGGVNITTVAKDVCTGVGVNGDSCGLWNWVDFDSCPGGLLEIPYFHVNTVCESCVHTADYRESGLIV